MISNRIISIGLAANIFLAGTALLTHTPILYILGGLCSLSAICWDIATSK